MKMHEKLFKLRKERGLTQLQLAEILQVSRQAISRWEMGVATPSTDNLKSISQLYDIPLDYLLHDNVELVKKEEQPATEESSPQEKASEEESSISKGQKNRKKMLMAAGAILVGVLVVILIIVGIHIGKQAESAISYDEMSGDAIESFGGEFNLEV